MVSAYEELLLSARQKKIKKEFFSQTISPRIWRILFSREQFFETNIRKQVSPSVLVAVLDSGIDLSHPALSQAIWENDQEKKRNQRGR